MSQDGPVRPVRRVYLVAQVCQDSIFSSTVWLHYGGGGVWNLKSPPSSRLNKFVCRTDLYDSTPTAPSQIRQIHFVSVVADGRKWRQPSWGVIDHKPRTLVWVSCGGGVINSKQMELSIVRGTYSIRCGLWLAMKILQLKTGFINCHEVQWITWSNE